MLRPMFCEVFGTRRTTWILRTMKIGGCWILLRDSVSLQKRPARALYGRERALRAYSYGDARALSLLVQACDELLGDLPPGADAFLQRIDLGNASELVVCEGAVALLREAGVDFVAPASLVLGCKREKSGEAVVLIAAAALDVGVRGRAAAAARRAFASEAHGDALADARRDILRRALRRASAWCFVVLFCFVTVLGRAGGARGALVTARWDLRLLASVLHAALHFLASVL